MKIRPLKKNVLELENDGKLSVFFIGVGSAFAQNHTQTNLLVKSLPEETSSIMKRKDKFRIKQILALDAEKTLKIGGLVLIVLNLLYIIVKILYCIDYDNMKDDLFIIFTMVDAMIIKTMFGLLCYALGQIIGLLKRGINSTVGHAR